MTKYKDHTELKTDYLGQPTEARDELCPCRPCWRPHDLTSPEKIYNDKGVHVRTVYHPDFRCLTRHQSGCPYPVPLPVHLPRPDVKHPTEKTRCRRCHESLVKSASRDDQRRDRDGLLFTRHTDTSPEEKESL